MLHGSVSKSSRGYNGHNSGGYLCILQRGSVAGKIVTEVSKSFVEMTAGRTRQGQCLRDCLVESLHDWSDHNSSLDPQSQCKAHKNRIRLFDTLIAGQGGKCRAACWSRLRSGPSERALCRAPSRVEGRGRFKGGAGARRGGGAARHGGEVRVPGRSVSAPSGKRLRARARDRSGAPGGHRRDALSAYGDFVGSGGTPSPAILF